LIEEVKVKDQRVIEIHPLEKIVDEIHDKIVETEPIVSKCHVPTEVGKKTAAPKI
jgi:hypothetical protein